MFLNHQDEHFNVLENFNLWFFICYRKKHQKFKNSLNITVSKIAEISSVIEKIKFFVNHSNKTTLKII